MAAGSAPSPRPGVTAWPGEHAAKANPWPEPGPPSGPPPQSGWSPSTGDQNAAWPPAAGPWNPAPPAQAGTWSPGQHPPSHGAWPPRDARGANGWPSGQTAPPYTPSNHGPPHYAPGPPPAQHPSSGYGAQVPGGPPAHGYGSSPYLPVVVQEPSRSPEVAALFSAVLPGLGQMYNNQVGKGLAFLGATILGWVALVGWVFHIWSVIDAFQEGRRQRQLALPPGSTPAPVGAWTPGHQGQWASGQQGQWTPQAPPAAHPGAPPHPGYPPHPPQHWPR